MMTYLHFNKTNGYPYGNLSDLTRTKDYKQERERVRTIMHNGGQYAIKGEDGEIMYSVEHRTKKLEV